MHALMSLAKAKAPGSSRRCCQACEPQFVSLCRSLGRVMRAAAVTGDSCPAAGRDYRDCLSSAGLWRYQLFHLARGRVSLALHCPPPFQHTGRGRMSPAQVPHGPTAPRPTETRVITRAITARPETA
jgi:hypothetical protein